MITSGSVPAALPGGKSGGPRVFTSLGTSQPKDRHAFSVGEKQANKCISDKCAHCSQ